MQSRGPPQIYATSDVHSPRYLSLLVSSLPEKGEACLFLLAGDIVDRGRVEAAKPVFDAVRQKFPGSKLVAVFGNEEYHDREDEYRRAYPYVDWLSDEYRIYDCNGTSIAIIGTRGAID
ncbi:MAG: metallophosphoesterase, partial [Desulfurococcales archaeon]|nr:metallophosphoesterase [Desulfurococcales archaeon]